MDPAIGDSGSAPDGQAAPPSDGKAEAPRWTIVFRNALGAGVGSFVATLPLRLFGLVPELVVVRVFAIVTLLAAIVYVVRWEMHVEILYHYESGGKAHVSIVVCEGVVATLFLACGPICFFWPDGVGQFAAATALLAAGFSIDLAMSWLVRNRGIRTGTEVAEHCGLIGFLRFGILKPVDHVRVFKWIDERWDLKAPWGKVSYLGLWLAATLTTVASANAPRVAPPVYEFLNDGQSAAIERVETSEGGGANASAGDEEAGTSSSAGDSDETESSGSADECGTRPAPGEAAPEPQRGKLYDQWLGTDGLGFAFAGCPNPAHRLANGVWYAAGTCGSALRSLAVAAPHRASGAILLWAPARFALARTKDGSLRGATSSKLAGEGEIYTVTTDDGTFLFMRDHVSDGGGGLVGTPHSCKDIREDAVPYIVVPPALTRLWNARLEAAGAWLWPLSEAPFPEGGTDYIFRDSDPAGSREVIGHCDIATDCTLRIDGIISHSSGPGAIDVRAALERAPPVP